MFEAELFAAMFRIATPITLAALGGLLCQRAGVFNIGLEGLMMFGAFAGAAAADASGGNAWVALAAGCGAGLAVALFYGLCIVKLRTDQILAGIAVNLLGIGLTSYILKAWYGTSGSLRPDLIDKIGDWTLPLVSSVPWLGQIIGNHSPVVYLSLSLTVVVWVILSRTPVGLAIRAVGEMPDAARTAGLAPDRVRLGVILWSGALCGLAGAHLSVGIVSEFSENMIQGRGFSAFTAIVFSRGSPGWTLLVCLLFGLADAFGIRLEISGLGIPPSRVKMFPYILSLAVLTASSIVVSRRGRAA